MMRRGSRAATGVVLVLAASLASGCSSGDSAPAATVAGAENAACDGVAIGETLGHILAEANMVVVSLDDQRCSADWADVVATVAENGVEGSGGVEHFLLQRDADIWVLKAPESACGTFGPGEGRPADALVPADLWTQACLTN